MGCNCNKGKGKTSMSTRTTTMKASYLLTRRDGTTQSFGSRLEAEAERTRSGGGSVRRTT